MALSQLFREKSRLFTVQMMNKLKQKAIKLQLGLIAEEKLMQSINSYLGILSHANSYKLKQDILRHLWSSLKPWE